MSLTVITRKRKLRRFLTYDLEWVPGSLKLRLCGVYDGERYRHYTSIRAFLRNELTSKNRGKWFYAHAGGLADFQFVLEEIASQEGKYEVKAAFSGSSAIIVHIKRGKNSWHFVDSYWLLRDKLDNIGDWIGIEKGAKEKRLSEEQAKIFYATAPIQELITYNEKDCIILWEAIHLMESVLLDLGGQLQCTLASSAMQLFRRRFLSEDIDTSNTVNERIASSYCASRVEVIDERCWDSLYYDINSSFPHAMTLPCPGELIGSSRSIPDFGIYIADATVEVPDCFFPPLPLRMKGRLFFPVGKWRSWFTGVDLELLEREGGRIVKVHECLQFEPFHDLANYAMTLYDMRKKAQTSFERMAFKLLLNSLYGKFAEGRSKKALHLNPKDIDRANWEMLFPGAWLYEKVVPVPHRHVPISAHITAIARRTIYNAMSNCSDFHYCDTDGFSTTNQLETSPELGDLKLEKRIERGIFHAAKVYLISGKELQKDGSWTELGDKGAKAKGFSRMTVDKLMRLMEGEAIKHERMARIRELARKGETTPREVTFMKRLQNVVLAKRFHYPDGTTRPWDVRELESYFKGSALSRGEDRLIA